MLVLLVGTTINNMSHLIASIASSCGNLGFLSYLLVQWTLLGRMAQILAYETSPWLITLYLIGHLGRRFLFGHFNIVGPTLVWTLSSLMSI